MPNLKSASYELSIYYDGMCPVCSKEINHYKKKEKSHLLRFVDIASPTFDARSEGLNPEGIHKRFHVKTKDGEILDGVDAFQRIWQVLDIFKVLDSLVRFPLTRPFFDMGYILFAKVRPYLRRKDACDTGYCEQKSL